MASNKGSSTYNNIFTSQYNCSRHDTQYSFYQNFAIEEESRVTCNSFFSWGSGLPSLTCHIPAFETLTLDSSVFTSASWKNRKLENKLNIEERKLISYVKHLKYFLSSRFCLSLSLPRLLQQQILEGHDTDLYSICSLT